MIAVNFSTARSRFKDFCDKVTDEAETVIITRKAEKNVVIISVERYNELVKAEQGESVIKQNFLQSKRSAKAVLKQAQDDILSVLQTTIDMLQNAIGTLQEQLEVKDRQIEQQAQTITRLTEALVVSQQTAAAAQALHAGTMHQQLLSDESQDGGPIQEASQKRGLIGKVLGKRKGKRMA